MSSHIYQLIDSDNRIYGTSENFSINLNLEKNQNFKSVSVEDVQFLKSYLMVDSTNNTFSVTEDTGPLTFSVTIVPERNYSATQLATELAERLIARSASHGNSYNYTVAFNPDSGYFLIGTGAGGDFTLNFSSNAKLGQYLGFTATTHESTANSVLSVKSADLQRYNNIQIRSTLCRNGRDNVLVQVPIRDVEDGDIINYQPITRQYRGVQNADSDTHTFIVTDVNGASIDLNGGSIQFELVFIK